MADIFDIILADSGELAGYGAYQNPQEASQFAKLLNEQAKSVDSEVRYKIKKRPEGLQDWQKKAWRERERARFRNGDYVRVPWYRFKFAKEIHDTHYPHLSLEDPSKVAFTANEDAGFADKQMRMSPGKYLKTHFGDRLTDAQIKELASRVTAAAAGMEYHLAWTPDDIEKVYINGPHSCMAYELSEGDGVIEYHEDGEDLDDEIEELQECIANCDCGDCNQRLERLIALRKQQNSEVKQPQGYHPCRAYGAGDLAVAYLGNLDEGKISARTVVWPEKKIYSGKAYGDPSRVKALFKMLEADSYRDKGFFNGAHVLAIPNRNLPSLEHENRSTRFKLPYLDCADSPHIESLREGMGLSYLVLGRSRHTETTPANRDKVGGFNTPCNGCRSVLPDSELKSLETAIARVCKTCEDKLATCKTCNNKAFPEDLHKTKPTKTYSNDPFKSTTTCLNCLESMINCRYCGGVFRENEQEESDEYSRFIKENNRISDIYAEDTLDMNNVCTNCKLDSLYSCFNCQGLTGDPTSLHGYTADISLRYRLEHTKVVPQFCHDCLRGDPHRIIRYARDRLEAEVENETRDNPKAEEREQLNQMADSYVQLQHEIARNFQVARPNPSTILMQWRQWSLAEGNQHETQQEGTTDNDETNNSDIDQWIEEIEF